MSIKYDGPVLLIIMDGVGINEIEAGNAVRQPRSLSSTVAWQTILGRN